MDSQFVDKLNFFMLRLKKNKKYDFDKSFLGINLGSEDNTIPEYIGIDGSFLIFLINNKLIPKNTKKKLYSKTYTARYRPYEEFEKKLKKIKIVYHNLLYGIPFQNNVVPNIYTSHFLEHLTRQQGEKILKECFRVLKKGGVLRICIPSIEDQIEKIGNAVKEYNNGNSEPIQEFLTVPSRDISPLNFSLHRKLYGFEDLKEVLERIGFRNVKKFSFRKGNLPKVEKIEMRYGLIVEAVKP